MDVSWADNIVKKWCTLPISNSKPDHNINAHTKFGENPLIFEPEHDKTNKVACAPSEDSDQPGHLLSLVSLLCPHEESLGP